MPSLLYQTIFDRVSQIPPGRVAGYGQVARAAGLYRGARMVGWALGSLPPDTAIPWQRVVNRKGELTITNPRYAAHHQAVLLRHEGVEVTEQDGCFILPNPPWYEFPQL
jgi:methylated-DNA-protein-cysteine methyltransferase-like protein